MYLLIRQICTVATLIQFKRLANVYFLLTAILQFIPIISPLSPFSAIAPLIFVLLVSLIRTAVQEIGKYRYDRQANSSMFQVYHHFQEKQSDSQQQQNSQRNSLQNRKSSQNKQAGEWQMKRSDELHVGDIIKIAQDQRFPSDIILLSTSNPDGKAYIQTSSLDGEKNLKPRNAIPTIQPLYQNVSDIAATFSHKPLLTVEEPNQQLYNFNGIIQYTKFSDKPIYGMRGKKQMRCSQFIKINQLLYRESVLKNTKYIIGVICYVGKFTKSMMNSTDSTVKMSKLQRKVNFYMIFIFLLQFLLILVCGVLRIYLFYSTENGLVFFQTVIKQTLRNYFLEAVLTSCSYFILLNTMIPISLLVSIEIVKFGQGMFIGYDRLISKKDANGDITWARAFRSVINEELGMVQYIFTDKTGTLTKNQMSLKQIVIGNQVYSNQDHPKTKQKKDYYFNTSLSQTTYLTTSNQFLQKFIPQLLTQPQPLSQLKPQSSATEFMNTLMLLIMSTCHQCLLVTAGSQGNQEDQYHGSSPDEITLVDSAQRLGIKFLDISAGKARLQIGAASIVEIGLSDVFQFDSDRKRMTVVLEMEQLIGYKLVFCKGADSSIDKLLLPSYKTPQNPLYKLYQQTQQKITGYSNKGLRTLLLGYKLLPNSQYTSLKQKLYKASDSPQQKSHIIMQMQQNLHLCGATAVEDKLQDQVQETIEDIIKANIKICMLTGDKMETAENIAKSCKLFDPTWKIVRVGEGSGDVDIFRGYCVAKKYIQDKEKFGVIVEGGSITKALDSVYFKQIFQNCSASVCCRITPKNKAQVVLYTKNQLDKLVLSIGDGANDVPMIQAANIGIGLYGNQGMNAVQASDFAIPQFKCLWRLLFIHGRWNYLRIAELIKYFFYKNLVFTLGQLWFAYVCGFSGQSIYDATYLVLFNTIFTGGPVIVRALLEQDLNYVNMIEELQIQQDTLQNRKSEVLQQKLLPPPALPLPPVSKLLSIETVKSLLPRNFQQQQQSQKQNKESKDQRFHKNEIKKINKIYFDYTLKKLFPLLYGHSQGELSLTPRLFALLILQAIIESFCIFLTIFYGIQQPQLSIFSISLYTVVLALVTIRICYQISYWTWLMVSAILFTSLIPYLLFVYLMSILQIQLYGTFVQLFTLPDFYVCVFLALGVGSFVQACFSVVVKYYFPTVMDTVRKQWKILKSKEQQQLLSLKQQQRIRRRQTIKQQYLQILQSNRSQSGEYRSNNVRYQTNLRSNSSTNRNIEIQLKQMRINKRINNKNDGANNDL